MAENDIYKRWGHPEFLQQVTSTLAAIFLEKSTNVPVDLRGVVVGLDGALPQLLHADFQNLQAAQIDASRCRVSCSFSRARIEKSRFDAAVFDTCRFKESAFDQTSFNAAKFDSPILDDAIFRGCSFQESRIVGRGLKEYGGRRIVFEKCNFQNACFCNVQLRACSFRECVWDNVVFENCILVGIKFEGTQPLDGSFVGCEKS